MKISPQYRGQKFTIYAIVYDDGSCPTVDFLEQVKRNKPAAHRSLVSVYKWHADSGPIINERKSKIIEGRKNLYEFKSSQGYRIPYFYLPNGRTVLTHGFHKGSPAKIEAEYDKAEKLRDQYLEEHGLG